MTYSDYEIANKIAIGTIGVEPYNPDNLNPASLDLTLAADILVQDYSSTAQIDLRNVSGDYMMPNRIDPEIGYPMYPGDFLLACTEEVITLHRDFLARVEGKSSLARLGLSVHATGGFIDPGFSGQITLEMTNHLHRPLRLYPGLPIAQIAFEPVTGKVVSDYSTTGRYQGQRGPTMSRYGKGAV